MRCTYVVATAILLLFTTQSFANNGVFMVVKGDVRIKPKSGSEQKVKVGSKVQEGDTIIAAKDSRAKVVMVDKNILNISPDSKVVIEKYKFDEASDSKSVSLNVLQGKLRSTVNQKYDGEKNQYNVKTPSAVAGVRGTDFVAGFNPITSATKIITFEGQVMTGSGFDAAGKIMNAVPVNPGQFTVASPGAPPAQPVAIPKNELASMNAETKADAPAPGPGSGPGNNGEKRSPSNDGGSGNDLSPEKGSSNGPVGGGSMGVDSKDMTAENGPAPAGASAPVPILDCANCGRPDAGFPQQLPSELINNGKTKLIINITQ